MAASHIRPAGDLGKFRGGSGFPVAYQGEKCGELPFFKVSDMNSPGNELFMSRANNYISESRRKRLGAVRVSARAIIFAKVGAAVFLERKRILTQDSCIDNNMAAFIVDEGQLDVRFAHYLLVAFRMSDLVAVGALPSLNGGQLRSMPLLVPSDLSEQRRVVHALAAADDLIDGLERLIAKKQAIKLGMMQELLTGRTRLEGFTGPWALRPLGDLLAYEQPSRYLVASTNYTTSGTPVLTAGKTFILGHTQERNGIFEAVPVIIFDDFTTASKYVEFSFKAKSSAMKMLSACPGINVRFIFERMQLIDFVAVDHKRRWIAEYSRIQVAVPPLDEQDAVAAVIQDAGREIEALNQRLIKTRAIKQGMMQQLLTGRVRLPVEADV
ncbi:restriction endonuclease subunit S [Clavibacter michiganensis subsp. michiganensis]|uniref:restriction endonuclease subunit S n=1 Tax=Clavibacter michiganensis TaxID=28447 RepID=UPI0020B13517|nr:restriction endonuclease subunit S [Clavibacter michiganensis]MWJ85021.1 restriction endonuclease subunit S [Clavibacter michiganensis subsp. michiganensis]